MKNRLSKPVTVVFSILLVGCLLALVVIIPYQSQQRRINKLNAQVSSLTRQLSQQPATSAQPTDKPAMNQMQSTAQSYTSTKGTTVKVYVPKVDSILTSPTGVIGEVPGSWSFEASFPVQLVDAKGTIIARATAHVLGDWMTSNLTPFFAQLTYSAQPTASTGSLILHKDNPSGLSSNDDKVVIPIRY